MNSNLGKLFVRRSSSSSYINYHILRHKTNIISSVYKNPLKPQTLSLCTERKPRYNTFNCKPFIVDPYCQSGLQANSSNLPHTDRNLDVRKVHHILQFGLAVQEILPSK